MARPSCASACRRGSRTNRASRCWRRTRWAGIPDHGLDLIVVNSLLQYLSLDEFRQLLEVWRVKLKPDGKLVLADVIPPDTSPLTDAKALLTFAWAGGFVRSALLGLARTAVSEYRKFREELGLSQYGEAEMIELLGDLGYTAERDAPIWGTTRRE